MDIKVFRDLIAIYVIVIIIATICCFEKPNTKMNQTQTNKQRQSRACARALADRHACTNEYAVARDYREQLSYCCCCLFYVYFIKCFILLVLAILM